MQPACLRSWGASFLPVCMSPEEAESQPDVWVAARWLALRGVLSTCVTICGSLLLWHLLCREGAVSVTPI